MEDVKIIKEIKYLDSIGKWCVAIFCPRPKNSIWTGGYFHKNKNKATNLAMDSFERSLKYIREVEKSGDVEELIVKI